MKFWNRTKVKNNGKLSIREQIKLATQMRTKGEQAIEDMLYMINACEVFLQSNKEYRDYIKQKEGNNVTIDNEDMDFEYEQEKEDDHIAKVTIIKERWLGKANK